MTEFLDPEIGLTDPHEWTDVELLATRAMYRKLPETLEGNVLAEQVYKALYSMSNRVLVERGYPDGDEYDEEKMKAVEAFFANTKGEKR